MARGHSKVIKMLKRFIRATLHFWQANSLTSQVGYTCCCGVEITRLQLLYLLQSFLQATCLPVTQPALSCHWRKLIALTNWRHPFLTNQLILAVMNATLFLVCWLLILQTFTFWHRSHSDSAGKRWSWHMYAVSVSVQTQHLPARMHSREGRHVRVHDSWLEASADQVCSWEVV